jgi:hypothetical protein
MKPKEPNGNQGEGDRVSARHYNDAASEFAARTAKRRPRGTRVSVDELVEMGRSVVDRVKPYVDRAVARLKSKLDR